MKVKMYTGRMASALLLACGVPMMAQADFGGAVHFDGRVVEGTCAVEAGSRDQTVILDQVRVAELISGGASTTSKMERFEIVLEDCDTTGSGPGNSAEFIFSGLSPSGSNGVLSNTAGVGAATGVGLQLFDHTSERLTLGQPSAPWGLMEGRNVVPFGVAYTTDIGGGGGTITPGAVQATATFSIVYN